ELARFLKEYGIRNMDATNPLNAFNNHGANIAAGKLSLECIRIVHFQKQRLAALVDGSGVFIIVGDADGRGGASVEALFEGNDFGAAVMKGGGLERIFVSFGS